MNFDMSDANFAQLFLDACTLDSVIDEQMHRLAENCGAAHTRHLVHGVECRSDVVASYVEPARSRWVYVRQFFQVVRLTANDQFRQVDVAYMRKLRQLFAAARDVRRDSARAKISVLRLSNPLQARIWIWVGPRCRCAPRRRYGSDQATRSRPAVHLRHRRRIKAS